MKEALAKAIEAHNSRGTAGLRELAKREPKAREAVEKLRAYIRENYRQNASERCWPGDLAQQQAEIEEYALQSSQV